MTTELIDPTICINQNVLFFNTVFENCNVILPPIHYMRWLKVDDEVLDPISVFAENAVPIEDNRPVLNKWKHLLKKHVIVKNQADGKGLLTTFNKTTPNEYQIKFSPLVKFFSIELSKQTDECSINDEPLSTFGTTYSMIRNDFSTTNNTFRMENFQYFIIYF